MTILIIKLCIFAYLFFRIKSKGWVKENSHLKIFNSHFEIAFKNCAYTFLKIVNLIRSKKQHQPGISVFIFKIIIAVEGLSVHILAFIFLLLWLARFSYLNGMIYTFVFIAHLLLQCSPLSFWFVSLLYTLRNLTFCGITYLGPFHFQSTYKKVMFLSLWSSLLF